MPQACPSAEWPPQAEVHSSPKPDPHPAKPRRAESPQPDPPGSGVPSALHTHRTTWRSPCCVPPSVTLCTAPPVHEAEPALRLTRLSV